ncbi:thiol reductant ABC exporter subunit CydC [Lentzea sp. NBRC 105346]|uniref:thiol reductant ABC exporter subunit CydD n=1 Tax=Lentzea sp. NBRC 105346 TaxID=3032205 RepID=UPI0024A41AF9|nr:thiol reductant ABC exporter subunit CydD [Lentzea sp. NBRC 105346]GLZ32569.1 thiol reductant ABC exporter subunit CydC [Lentzea sp. NBRC 105346]
MRGPLGALPALSRSARKALVLVGVLAFLNALALVAQAVALATALTAHTGLPLLLIAVVARAGLAWATESAAARAAAGAKEELRTKLLASAMARGPEWISARGPAELAVLATKGLDALDAYFTRYLPALVTAVVVPPVVGAWILWTDWTSAALIVVTVPLIPVFAALIGWYTEKRVARAAEVTERLSGYLLELLRALPVLTVFGRAKAQAEAVRAAGEQHRRATMGTLRVAFLSALVLEIAASLSVALIAVGIGLRLVSGDLTLATALVVLILAPECYLPLRAAGAAHHASEDGLEAVRRVAEVVGDVPAPADSGERPVQRISVRNLRVLRRGGFAPDGVSFDAVAGRIHRLGGASGAGKSTTLGVLLGFVTPHDGTVDADGDLNSRTVAWIPQRPAFAASTVDAELELAEPRSTERQRHRVLAEVAAGHLAHRPITQLSTGERQRVAVARALLRMQCGANVLLADEPTAHLDAATAAKVDKAIKRVADLGAIVVLATHRTAEQVEDETPALLRQSEELPEQAKPKRLLTRRALAGAALGIAASASGVALTALSAYLIARAAEQPPIFTLSVLVVGVRTFALAKGVLRYTERLVSHDAAFRLAERLRVDLWHAMVRLGPARVRPDGLQRLADDTDTVRDLVPRVLFPPIVAAGVGAGTVALFAFIDPRAALALAVALLIGGIAAPLVATLTERRASLVLAQGRREIAAEVLTVLTAAPDLIAGGAHERKLAELERKDAELAKQARRQAFGTGAATAILHLTTGGAALVCTALGAGLTGPVLGLVPLALAEVLSPLPLAAQQRRTLVQAHQRLSIDVSKQPEPLRGKRIRLSHVDVGWPGGDPVLTDVNLDVRPGTHLAVVGPSGTGKSTLVALLLGFLQPSKGIVELPRATWCPQDPQLISTTVRENLRMSGPHDDERLRWALRQAALPHWTDRLDVVIRQDQVSGGEAQRLALARALLHDADVLLLDEPTAHLDDDTAYEILINLSKIDKTIVHVTHRPEEAARADVVLDTGQPAYR